MDEWEASETNNLHQRFSKKKPRTGVTPCQHSNPWEVLLPRPESVSFLGFPVGFLLKNPHNFPVFFPPINRWAHSLPPAHSSDCWQLSWIQQLGENSRKGGQACFFWKSLWEPLHGGCSCWHSRESGKIVVNPPGHGSCFMPSPTGCCWGQPRAGRDTCSTGIVPFFGLATEEGGRRESDKKLEKKPEVRRGKRLWNMDAVWLFWNPRFPPWFAFLLCS